MSDFAERRMAREERARAERELAGRLRSMRCFVCKQPLLWHDDPEAPGSGGIKCKLNQTEVISLSEAREIGEGETDPRG